MNTHLVLPAILPSSMAMALPVPTDVLLLDVKASWLDDKVMDIPVLNRPQRPVSVEKGMVEKEGRRASSNRRPVGIWGTGHTNSTHDSWGHRFAGLISKISCWDFTQHLAGFPYRPLLGP